MRKSCENRSKWPSRRSKSKQNFALFAEWTCLGQIKGGAVPPTERREEDIKSSKYSFLPIEGFLSLCELAMTLSSHQIIVSWKERSISDMPVNLILIFFSSSSKYLIWSVNIRSVLICYTTLISSGWIGIEICTLKQPYFRFLGQTLLMRILPKASSYISLLWKNFCNDFHFFDFHPVSMSVFAFPYTLGAEPTKPSPLILLF